MNLKTEGKIPEVKRIRNRKKALKVGAGITGAFFLAGCNNKEKVTKTEFDNYKNEHDKILNNLYRELKNASNENDSIINFQEAQIESLKMVIKEVDGKVEREATRRYNTTKKTNKNEKTIKSMKEKIDYIEVMLDEQFCISIKNRQWIEDNMGTLTRLENTQNRMKLDMLINEFTNERIPHYNKTRDRGPLYWLAGKSEPKIKDANSNETKGIIFEAIVNYFGIKDLNNFQFRNEVKDDLWEYVKETLILKQQ